MIRYNLRCEKGHAFESWFQSSAAYESQEKRNLVSCPSCGSVKVERAIMAPQIVTSQPDTTDPAVPQPGAGGPYTLQANAQKVVSACLDKDGMPVPLAACLDAAAYSSFFKFATGRVISK